MTAVEDEEQEQTRRSAVATASTRAHLVRPVLKRRQLGVLSLLLHVLKCFCCPLCLCPLHVPAAAAASQHFVSSTAPHTPCCVAVSRFVCRSELYEFDLTLDINIDIYPLKV